MRLMQFNVQKLFVISLLLLFSQNSLALKKTKLTYATYNVENLFDNIKDSGRTDYEYLPLKSKQTTAHKQYCNTIENPHYRKECLEYDYSDEVVNEKLKRVADTILQVDGRGPDVLVLNEVENLRILQTLNKNYLKAAGYKTAVLIEGDDTRGIDVALLSRLPLRGKAKLHRIRFTDPKTNKPVQIATRGILDVQLALPKSKKTLRVFGFHFPSQANPRWMRQDAVETLNDLIHAAPASNLVIASGDANITADEEKETGFFSKTLSEYWHVSHLIGCASCEGTHYYNSHWSFLDVLLFSDNLINAVDTTSIQTLKNGHYQLQENGTPARFNPNASVGVSDHLPLFVELAYPTSSSAE